ncbi:hypothetical protein QVD17_25138 [Tagetes erecta]|uniref:AAA+ ATPase domain-containing protein n=1 Tax=Tagetes erecta TaxID=13708 RepID=A0AAD8KG66_TARER|nr:hypothetical protein QVD17_25138 [Tagetes erecta]
MTTSGRRSVRRIVEAMAVIEGSSNSKDAVKKAVKVLENRREKNPVTTVILLFDIISSVFSSTRCYSQSNIKLKPHQLRQHVRKMHREFTKRRLLGSSIGTRFCFRFISGNQLFQDTPFATALKAPIAIRSRYYVEDIPSLPPIEIEITTTPIIIYNNGPLAHASITSMTTCCSSYTPFYKHHYPTYFKPNHNFISTQTIITRSVNGTRFAKCTSSDDIHELLKILPHDLRDNLVMESKRDQLLEVILDLGRLPEARYLGVSGRRYLRDTEVSMEELEYAENAIGEIGGDNRAGITGTLHRISAVRNRKGVVVGLTCRVGRAVRGHIDMVRDLLQFGESILFIGRPGVGKTTVMREISRVLSDELQRRVVVVDTSNEIGGGGDIPHPAIGSTRRMQVSKPYMQHKVMIEAVENHTPQVIIIDEISTRDEVNACKSIAERGVMLIGSAHGDRLENIIKNPVLSRLAGGVETVTLGDQEARKRNSRKSISQRRGPPTFPFMIEMRDRHYWVVHKTERSVDALLLGEKPRVEVRKRDKQMKVIIEKWKIMD